MAISKVVDPIQKDANIPLLCVTEYCLYLFIVQLIVFTFSEVIKERHLNAELIKAWSKSPQCAHCGFSKWTFVPTPSPCLILFVCATGTLWHENCSRLCTVKSPENHADPWRLKIRVDVTGSALLSPLKRWHGTAAGQSDRESVLDSLCQRRMNKFIRTCTFYTCVSSNTYTRIQTSQICILESTTGRTTCQER